MRLSNALRAALLLAVFLPGPAFAGSLTAPFDPAAVRAQVGEKDENKMKCKAPPAPLRNLEFYSMYSDKEGSASTVDPKAYAAYKKAYEPISKYEVGLQDMANRYVRSSPARSDVAQCDQDWLAQWAEAGALLGKVNKNGEYTRKWLLASLANNWLQIKDDPNLDPEKSKVILKWIHGVADAAMSDFSRDEDRSSRRNNHLYWAAWGVGSAAIATDDRKMFDWAMERAKFGIDQIQADGTLPLEVARGKRAYLYHLFAAMPLFMLAEAGSKNGVDLFSENDQALKRLADVNLANVNGPAYFKELTGKEQDTKKVVTHSSLGWLEIYAKHYSDPRAQPVLDKYRPMKHSRMGGNITLLYAGKDIKTADNSDAGDDDKQDQSYN